MSQFLKSKFTFVLFELKRVMEAAAKNLKNDDDFAAFAERLEQKKANDTSGRRKIDAQNRRVKVQQAAQCKFADVIFDAGKEFIRSAAQEVRFVWFSSRSVAAWPLAASDHTRQSHVSFSFHCLFPPHFCRSIWS
jgi:hypothetical protein